MKLKLKQFTEDEAKALLQSVLDELGGYHADELTTFEISLIRRFASNPPKLPRRGAEVHQHEEA